MKYKIGCILIFISLFSCKNDQPENIVPQQEKVDAEAACDFCALQEEIIVNDKWYVSYYALGDTVKRDSVREIKDSLYLAKKEIIKEYNSKFELIDFETRDSLESLCNAHLPYGEGLNDEKVSRMMWYLEKEILQMNSGHSLPEGAYLESLKYAVNEAGDTTILKRGLDHKIDNFEEYKQGQIDSWNEWMVKINLYLKELTGMEYEEMSERDVFLLYFKLGYFKENGEFVSD
jgi:hypothetical protein